MNTVLKKKMDVNIKEFLKKKRKVYSPFWIQIDEVGKISFLI